MKQPILRTHSEQGFASIEATVLLVLFVNLIYYTFGFFGVVHTGVIHNIHSRTYLFETFRHRSNLMYFRSNRVASPIHYYNQSSRLHGINTDSEDLPANQVATERSITMGVESQEEGREANIHSQDVMTRVPANQRNTSVGTNPVWIMTMYGYCLQASCGG